MLECLLLHLGFFKAVILILFLSYLVITEDKTIKVYIFFKGNNTWNTPLVTDCCNRPNQRVFEKITKKDFHLLPQEQQTDYSLGFEFYLSCHPFPLLYLLFMSTLNFLNLSEFTLTILAPHYWGLRAKGKQISGSICFCFVFF